MEHGNSQKIQNMLTQPPQWLATVYVKVQEQESDLPVQAGQSPASLRAERAAAMLDGTDPQACKISTSSSDSPQRSSDEQGQRSSSDSHISRADTPPQYASRPHDDCALNHAATIEVRCVAREYNTTSSFGESSGPSSLALQTPSGKPIRRRSKTREHIKSPLAQPPLTRTPQSTFDQPRTGSPLAVQDLGSDYTRYYDPFTSSANSLAGRASQQSTRPSSRRSLNHMDTTASSSAAVDALTAPSDSTTKLLEDEGAEETIFFIDDRLGAPFEEVDGLAWPLWGDEAEDDDAMHLPHPDDDKIFRLHLKDYFSRENIVPSIGVILMLLGLLITFIGLPILVYTGVINLSPAHETPLDDLPIQYPPKEDWAWVNDLKYPLLHHMRSSLIDPDTPDHAIGMTGEFGDQYVLVFSDEFNDNNRTFYEGDDPYLFAPDLWYGATQDLEWYDPDAVTTWDGVLELRLDKFMNHGLEYRSGMLNSWNQLCFKGGIFEVSISLPGPAGVHGLWPGVWTLGNLGRPGYTATTDGTWPYTYQACDVGITPNQSSSDGLSWLPGQRLPSCTCPGEDHPSPGTGRGAPEIDIAEVSVSYDEGKRPLATQSYQVAPFDIWYYPNYDFVAFPDYQLSYTNTYTGGPFQQAVSATINLNRAWYDGQAYQRFSFEYVPGDEEHSYITWKVGGQTMFTLDSHAIGPNGNIQARQITQEPMALILNLGISNSWTWINWEELVFPAVMRVDYVRWYQKKGKNMVTCDPPGFETTQYIEEHIDAYKNPHLTTWDQTGYGWPKHKLNSDC